jgi:CRISPR/Cas system-associated exonuclease Cas4 (RecB family)
MITIAKTTEKKLLTYSALSTYRKCPKRFQLRYEQNLIPIDTDDKLFFGGVVHKALEAWHGCPTIELELRKRLVFEKIDDACKGWEKNYYLCKTRLLAMEMMIGYIDRYQDDDFDVIALEKEFNRRIVNPRTGAESKTFAIKGKVDGIVETSRGLFLLEHKTTSKLMDDPEDALWEDTQVSLYVAYLRDRGYEIVGVIYNELLKCTLIQKKGESEEDYQTRYAGLCTKSKTGTSTAKRQFPESDEEYALRVREWYQEGNRFQRTEMIVSDTQTALVRQDIWGVTQQYLDARRRGDWFCNRDGCHTLYGDCAYRRYCQSNYDEAVRQEMFELVAQPHTEFDSFGDV